MKEEQNAQGAAASAEPSGEAAPKDVLDLLRRERADFLNYKRRIQQERAEDADLARLEMLRRLLPLLDELDRALAQLPPDLESNLWAQGVALNRRLLHEALEDLGVERFGSPGDIFDPERHEALFFDPRPETGEQVVQEVLKPGYALRGLLLRPAQVGVIGPADVSSTAAPQGSARRAQQNQSSSESEQERG